MACLDETHHDLRLAAKRVVEAVDFLTLCQQRGDEIRHYLDASRTPSRRS
jgi:hypothetical protein